MFRPSFETLEEREVFSNTFGVWLTAGFNAGAAADHAITDHSATGRNLSGTGVFGTGAYRTAESSHVAAADFNGDGRPDLESVLGRAMRVEPSASDALFGIDFNPVPDRVTSGSAADGTAGFHQASDDHLPDGVLSRSTGENHDPLFQQLGLANNDDLVGWNFKHPGIVAVLIG